MPTYEYVCQNCTHEFEQFQSMRDAALTKCPACGKPRLKRKVGSGAGLIFKGSGFYITDYKKTTGGKESASGEAKGGESKPSVEPKAKKESPAATTATSAKS
jgi:putative FmdB family regulatory protein